MKVARGALVPGVKNLKKILKFSLGLFELEQRLPGVKRALLMLQSEGPNFFPLYRGKTPPRQGGAPARGGGGRPPGSENVENTSLYSNRSAGAVLFTFFRHFLE